MSAPQHGTRREPLPAARDGERAGGAAQLCDNAVELQNVLFFYYFFIIIFIF